MQNIASNIELTQRASFCCHPWSNLFLGFNGKVQPCCMNSTYLGNIEEDPIEDIWNGESLQKIRRLIGEKKYKEAGCASDCTLLYELEHTNKPIVLHEWKDLVQKSEKFRDNIEIYNHAVRNVATIAQNTPITLDIQPNLSCNMNCIMCSQEHSNKSKIQLESMLKLFVDYENIYSATFQGGEIFLYQDFTNFLIDLKQQFSAYQVIKVITNASSISFEEIEKLTKGGNPVKFILSIDSVHEDTYTFIRQNKLFKKVMRNLEYLCEIQKKENIQLVRLNFVVMKSNFFELKETIEFATEHGVEIFFQPILGNYPEENIFDYSELRDASYALYIDECIELAAKLDTKALNLETIKNKLLG